MSDYLSNEEYERLRKRVIVTTNRREIKRAMADLLASARRFRDNCDCGPCDWRDAIIAKVIEIDRLEGLAPAAGGGR